MKKEKQTAVEWLEMQLASKIADANIRISAPKFFDLINQAKAMEKEIIRTAYLDGMDGEYNTSEQYYKETFKSE